MNRRLTVTLTAMTSCLLAAQLGCQRTSTTHHHDHPATVEHLDDDFALVTLTAKAIERIDLQTTTVEMREEASPALVVPYSSLLYDAGGDSWVYVSPKERSFKREAVKVDRITGDDVFLSEGPEPGTVIATVGVAELYGTEFEVGH